MARKELVISAKLALQSEEFVQGIKAAQDQLNKMQNSAKTSQTTNQLNQQLRQMGYDRTGKDISPDTIARQARTARDEEKRFLDEKIAKMDKLAAIENRLTATINARIAVNKEDSRIKELERTRAQIETQRLKATAGVAAGAGAPPTEAPSFGSSVFAGYRSGGIKGAIAKGGQALGMEPVVAGVVAGIAGTAIIAAGALANKLMQDFATRPISLPAMQGSAMQGFMGKQLGQMQSGESVFEGGGVFGGERDQATGAAASARFRRGFLPQNLLNINRYIDPERYQAEQAAQEAEETNTAFEGFKGKKVFDVDATNRLQRNLRRDLGMQRTLGLGDKGLTQYQKGITGAGFSEEEGFGATSAILGAGGSTAMGQSPQTALRAQRGLNLTNANQMLGQLSNASMPESSKSMLIDIFSTAQAIGLDKSTYAQENRKFMQQVSDVVSGAGVGAGAGAGNIAQTMGDFTAGGKSMKEIERGKSAYETYQKSTTSTSGLQGAINMASAMKNPALMKAVGGDARLLESLVSMTQADLEAAPEMVNSLAAAANMSPDSFKKMLRGVRSGAAAAGQEMGQGKNLKAYTQKLKQHIDKTGSAAGFQFEGPEAAHLIAANMRATGQTAAESSQYLKGQMMQDLSEEGGDVQIPLAPTEYQKRFQKAKAEAGVALGEGAPMEKDRDKIIADSAKMATVSIDTLAKAIDRLTEASEKATGKTIAHTEAARDFAEHASRAMQSGNLSVTQQQDIPEIIRRMNAGQSTADLTESIRKINRADPQNQASPKSGP